MDGALPRFDTQNTLRQRWDGLSLTARFAIIGGMLMIVCAIVIGRYVTSRIEQNAINTSAVATALYIDSLIAPLVRDIKDTETLSVGPILALEQLLEQDLGRVFLSVKIWTKDGRLIYATDRDLIGQSFPPSEELLRAFNGEVVAETDTLGDEEDAIERDSGTPLLEIYSPIRRELTGEVIAVAEFYEIVEELDNTLRQTRLETWLLISLLTALIAAALTGIVRAGSRIIEAQRRALETQFEAAKQTSVQNQILRERVQKASEKSVELNEQYLRRISADLHDGPAQLLGFAALKIDGIRKRTKGRDHDDINTVATSLQEALEEIRQISRGLRLPQIENLSISEIVSRVSAAHSERTQTPVEIAGDDSDAPANASLKITLYRFMQESLSNAFQHGGGKGQKVQYGYHVATRKLTVSVSDTGKGMPQHKAKDADASSKKTRGLGLLGLQERIESIGGTFEVESAPGKGTKLTMQVTVEDR